MRDHSDVRHDGHPHRRARPYRAGAEPRQIADRRAAEPNAIPAGVVIVLGTQRVGLEVDAASLRPIVAHLEQDDRTIDMARLSRGSVRSIAEAVIDPALLRPETQDRIEQLSGGYPLALAYLAKRLAAVSNEAEIEAILDATVTYEGEIEADYRSYYAALRDDPAVP